MIPWPHTLLLMELREALKRGQGERRDRGEVCRKKGAGFETKAVLTEHDTLAPYIVVGGVKGGAEEGTTGKTGKVAGSKGQVLGPKQC